MHNLLYYTVAWATMLDFQYVDIRFVQFGDSLFQTNIENTCSMKISNFPRKVERHEAVDHNMPLLTWLVMAVFILGKAIKATIVLVWNINKFTDSSIIFYMASISRCPHKKQSKILANFDFCVSELYTIMSIAKAPLTSMLKILLDLIIN